MPAPLLQMSPAPSALLHMAAHMHFTPTTPKSPVDEVRCLGGGRCGLCCVLILAALRLSHGAPVMLPHALFRMRATQNEHPSNSAVEWVCACAHALILLSENGSSDRWASASHLVILHAVA